MDADTTPVTQATGIGPNSLESRNKLLLSLNTNTESRPTTVGPHARARSTQGGTNAGGGCAWIAASFSSNTRPFT